MSSGKMLVIAVCFSILAGFAFDKGLIGTAWGAGFSGFVFVMAATFSWFNGNK